MDAEWEQSGRFWLRGGVQPDELAALAGAVDLAARPGSRLSADLLELIRASRWATSLGEMWPGARAVRVVGFNKTAEANWGVPWHQDRVIEVAERHDMPGYGNWSRKAGAWHCEPPVEVLEDMLFVRVHLDPNLAHNGAMQISVGSHGAGVVRESKAAEVAARYEVETCEAAPGDVLVLKMLTLHRSLPSASDVPRRALRIDFARAPLPPPLAWV